MNLNINIFKIFQKLNIELVKKNIVQGNVSHRCCTLPGFVDSYCSMAVKSIQDVVVAVVVADGVVEGHDRDLFVGVLVVEGVA